MTRGGDWTRRILRDGEGNRRAWAAPIPWIVGLAGALAIGVAGIFGGLAPVQKQILVGDEKTVIDAGTVTASVEKALIFDTAEEVNVTLADDQDLLVMRVRVTNTFDEPLPASQLFGVSVYGDPLTDTPAKAQLVRVDEFAARPSLIMRLDASESSAIVLQPGVTTALGVGFIVSDDVDLTELAVRVDTIDLIRFVFLGDGESYWLESAGQVATITLPVSRAES